MEKKNHPTFFSFTRHKILLRQASHDLLSVPRVTRWRSSNLVLSCSISPARSTCSETGVERYSSSPTLVIHFYTPLNLYRSISICRQFHEQQVSLPSFTWDNSHALLLSLRCDSLGLPPLIVTGVGHMQDVPIVEPQALARQPTVFGWVIVKQGPETTTVCR